jgi:hypothetical protein
MSDAKGFGNIASVAAKHRLAARAVGEFPVTITTIGLTTNHNMLTQVRKSTRSTSQSKIEGMAVHSLRMAPDKVADGLTGVDGLSACRP